MLTIFKSLYYVPGDSDIFFFVLAHRYPANITLLRGNHESRQLTQVCYKL